MSEEKLKQIEEKIRQLELLKKKHEALADVVNKMIATIEASSVAESKQYGTLYAIKMEECRYHKLSCDLRPIAQQIEKVLNDIK